MDVIELECAMRRSATRKIAALVSGSVLRDMADGSSSIAAIHHPLGFVCLPILRDESIGVCVHVWPRDRQPPTLTTSPIHRHSWTLLSFVLYGAVTNLTMELVQGVDYQEFDVHSGFNHDELVATGRRVGVRAGDHDEVTEGQLYEMATGLYHATTVPDGIGSATVVLARWQPGAHDVALGDPDTPSHRVRRMRLDADAAAKTAQEALRG